MRLRPDSEDTRRAARTLTQGVWGAIAAVATVIGLDVPAELAPVVAVAVVPAAAALLAWVSNEWSDADEAWKRLVSRVLTVWARDGPIEAAQTAASEADDSSNGASSG